MTPRPFSRVVRAATLALASSLAWACNQPSELFLDHMKRGDAALADGHYAQALTAYTHARELAPSDPGVQRAMMQTRVHLVAESSARIGPDAFEDARYEASFLLDADKLRAATYLTALGNVLVRQGDLEGAKARYAEALKADPTSPLAHSALGLALMARKEDAAQAKAELEAALKAKPDAVAALIGLGQIKLGEGDATSAAAHLEAALRIGDDFGARMALGNARLQQQKTADAIEQFQRAVRLEPKSPDALASLGQALLNAGKAEDAERALRAATQMRPEIGTSIALGFALARQKKSELALGAFGQVLAEDARAAPALYGAGVASEELGRKDQALEYYRRLLALSTEGRPQQMITDLQRDAQTRVTVLTATQPAGSASAGVPRGAPVPGPRPAP
jgi:tetratricopeptide (TPR) repeat protein